MGFNKRFVTEKLTLKHLEENNLSHLYDKCDAFIFLDNFSSKVWELYSQGLTYSEIINQVKSTKK